MHKFISIALLVFVLQATIGLMAHCAGPVEALEKGEAQSMQMHHAMQSGDIQDADMQHDCCDADNESQTQFPDSCDCDSGVINALASLESLDITGNSVQYFSAVSLPLTEPRLFQLLRPPILT